MTERQISAVTLYFVAGLSFRQVGEVLGITQAATQRLVARGRATAIRDCANAASPEEAEARLRTMLAQPQRHVAAARQDQMLDAIEERINQSDSDLAAAEDCMRGEVRQVSHHALNTWDRWELELMGERGLAGMQSVMFEARRLARFIPDAAPT